MYPHPPSVYSFSPRLYLRASPPVDNQDVPVDNKENNYFKIENLEQKFWFNKDTFLATYFYIDEFGVVTIPK